MGIQDETDEELIEWFAERERTYRLPHSQWETLECWERGLELTRRLKARNAHIVQQYNRDFTRL